MSMGFLFHLHVEEYFTTCIHKGHLLSPVCRIRSSIVTCIHKGHLLSPVFTKVIYCHLYSQRSSIVTWLYKHRKGHLLSPVFTKVIYCHLYSQRSSIVTCIHKGHLLSPVFTKVIYCLLSPVFTKIVERTEIESIETFK